VTVLGIDPGRGKCGVAVCIPGRVVARAIVPAGQLPDIVARWTAEYQVDTVVVGAGTGSHAALTALRGLATLERPPAIIVQEERRTTLEARRRYFDAHPPRGWRRLLPLSFQLPPEAYDDYAAVVIAERFVERPSRARGDRGDQ
jgi:RNase H-fold protein (predicted Holliday junction resolvase)